MAPARFLTVLMGSFAAIALLLTVAGLYGVLSYMVARRRREIGVRIALGAGRGDVIGIVLRRAVLLVTAGLILGSAGAFGVGRLLGSVVFGVPREFPIVVAGACCVMAMTSCGGRVRAGGAGGLRGSDAGPAERVRTTARSSFVDPRSSFLRSTAASCILTYAVMMKSIARAAIAVAAGFCASAVLQAQNKANTTEKPFVSGGTIEMRLEGGNYTVRPAADNQIRVTLSGNTGNAKVELTASGTRANVVVKDTPNNNFQVTIEVPKAADLVIRLSAGNLVLAAIAGNKDIQSTAGNTEIAVGDPNDYASVDASVKAGDIDAGVFGGSKSGLFAHFTWSGRGKYTLRASLGAGNLVLRK